MKKNIKKYLLLALILLAPSIAFSKNMIVSLDVQGMTCPLCVSMINKALRQTEGVISAKTQLNTHEAVVVVPDDFETNDLLLAVEKVGYSATIKSVVEDNASSETHSSK